VVLSLFSSFVTNLTTSSWASPYCLYRMRMCKEKSPGNLKCDVVTSRTVWRQQRTNGIWQFNSWSFKYGSINWPCENLFSWCDWLL